MARISDDSSMIGCLPTDLMVGLHFEGSLALSYSNRNIEGWSDRDELGRFSNKHSPHFT